MKLLIIGAPYYLGKTEGAGTSVAVLKEAGIADELGAEWVDLDPPFAAFDNPVSAVNKALADLIAAQDDDTVSLVMVGDCTACLGVMKGLEAAEPDVLWFDAHGDFNTPETSPSQFLGGMPLAALVGRGNQDLMEAIDLAPIPERKITITDARDLDPGEAQALEESAIAHLTDIAYIRQIDWQQKPLYIHFDGDLIQLDDMPAVSYKAEGGPPLSQTIEGLRHAIRVADVKAILFSLWNNDLDGADKSTENTLQIIRAVAEELQA